MAERRHAQAACGCAMQVSKQPSPCMISWCKPHLCLSPMQSLSPTGGSDHNPGQARTGSGSSEKLIFSEGSTGIWRCSTAASTQRGRDCQAAATAISETAYGSNVCCQPGRVDMLANGA